MRVPLVLLVLIASLLFCSCVSPPPFTRDSIEGEHEEGFPDGWEVFSKPLGDYAVLIDRKIVHGGTASATLICLDTDLRGRGMLQQLILADNYAGRRVRFRAFVRTNRVQSWCALWMRADSESIKAIAFDNMYERRIEGTTDWTQYEVVLDIPKDTAVLTFGAALLGIGQMWLDDCVLEIVGDDVDTTGDYYDRTYPIRRPIGPDTPTEPVNMDFEGEVLEDVYDYDVE